MKAVKIIIVVALILGALTVWTLVFFRLNQVGGLGAFMDFLESGSTDSNAEIPSTIQTQYQEVSLRNTGFSLSSMLIYLTPIVLFSIIIYYLNKNNINQ